MQITIDQDEIELAIQNHVQSMLTIKEGQNMSISLKAGRGDNGFTATINIGEVTASVARQKEPEAPATVVDNRPQAAEEPSPVIEDPTPASKPTGNTLFGGLNSTRNLSNKMSED